VSKAFFEMVDEPLTMSRPGLMHRRIIPIIQQNILRGGPAKFRLGAE